MIKDKCGDEAAEVFPSLIESFDFGYVGLCKSSPQYFPDNPENVCSGTLEPTLDDPKGLQSISLNSYAFSYLCPNVGYGVISPLI